MGRGKKDARSCFRSRRTQVPIFREGVPRNGGLGAMTVSTAAGKVLTGSGPQSLFGSFLVIQKGTRPAGRNLSYHKKKGFVYQRIIKKS